MSKVIVGANPTKQTVAIDAQDVELTVDEAKDVVARVAAAIERAEGK